MNKDSNRKAIRSNRQDEVIAALCRELEGGATKATIDALRAIKERAVPAIPAILAATTHATDAMTSLLLVDLLREVVREGYLCVMQETNDRSAAMRTEAVCALSDLGPLGLNVTGMLCTLAANDRSKEVRKGALFSLHSMGVYAASIIRLCLMITEPARTQQMEDSLRTQAVLMRERLLEAGGDVLIRRRERLLVSLKSGERRKRVPAELEKSLIALLDTCLDWSQKTVSERQLHSSELLKEKRRSGGLGEKVSVATVHNHLRVLATLCGVPSIVETEGKRQSSKFRPKVRDLLLRVRNEIERAAREEESRFAAVDKAVDTPE